MQRSTKNLKICTKSPKKEQTFGCRLRHDSWPRVADAYNVIPLIMLQIYIIYVCFLNLFS